MDDKKTKWFDEARFGLFIHWGLYSLLGRGEWVLYHEHIPAEEYRRLADRFKPDPAAIEEWLALAKCAGAKYVVLTTRHADGFALFDSRASDFTSVKTEAKRDYIRVYADACRKAGLKLGFYYSIMSWQFPAIFSGPHKDPANWEKMVQQTHAQVRELMTNYGKVDLLWYDGCMVPGACDPPLSVKYWRTKELNRMVRQLQPHILINDRACLPEDFDTPEQHLAIPKPPRKWELCLTINGAWGYTQNDHNYKSADELLRCLITCAQHGGNLLLNIGPKADGSVPAESVKRLNAMGDWLRINGESIYGANRSGLTENDQLAGPVTQKHNRLYFHLFDLPGERIRIAGIKGKVKSAAIIGTGQPLNVAAPYAGILDITGLPGKCPPKTPVPLVIKINPAGAVLAGCAPEILGGIKKRETAEEPALVITKKTRYEPPSGEILWPKEIEKTNRADLYQTVPGETLCPGWRETMVLTDKEESGRFNLSFDVAVTGRYVLKLGIITKEPGRLNLSLDKKPAVYSPKITSVGYPMTICLPEMTFKKGKHILTLATPNGSPLGLYGCQFDPVWRPVSSESWLTIGPFPTGFNYHTGVDEVRKALETKYPPEGNFERMATYPGAEGKAVVWRSDPKRRQYYFGPGVNLVRRCAAKTIGLCYARTIIVSPEERAVEIAIGTDWWARGYLNGKIMKTNRAPKMVKEDGAYFNAWTPMASRQTLQKGKNVLLVKNHLGSANNWFTCFISDPGDLKISPKP